MSEFEKSLKHGLAGESAISRWLRRKGYYVLPAYEKIIDNNKGPRVFTPNKNNLITPDLLAWKIDTRTIWIEAKHKTAFSWHRKTQRWVTGIDRKHYRHYLEIQNQSPWDIWLLFLHEGGQAKDSPPSSPAGLYGNSIERLRRNVNHEHENHGPSGMVYWAVGSLILMANINEISPAASTAGDKAKKHDALT
jgi:hypothetical protein